MTGQTDGKGLLASLSVLAGTLTGIIHTRLDLLSSDLEEDREHWLSLLVLALVALFFMGVGVVLAVILLVVAFWDTYRLLALGTLAALFLGSGLAAWLIAVRRARAKPRLFEATLSELRKDRQQLTSRP
ncbi:MAG: phage holin family protein [Parasulfuritortus sp.]|jgi:uncharacterized membrane protein YqjE|nr:phage holin family protein [Parasulfuritortus sp.]